MRQIIIFGVGSLAQVCCHYLTNMTPNIVAGFVVDSKYKESDALMGRPVITTDEMLDVFPPDSFDLLVAIGYSNMRNRLSTIERLSTKNYNFTNLISDENCDGVINGINNIILPGSIIEPFTCIGNHNIIWSGAHICHNVTIDDNNFFASGSIIGGYTNVSNGCFFGFGSIVKENINISTETLVAAGAVIIKDTEVSSKYIGVPGKKIGDLSDTGVII